MALNLDVMIGLFFISEGFLSAIHSYSIFLLVLPAFVVFLHCVAVLLEFRKCTLLSLSSSLVIHVLHYSFNVSDPRSCKSSSL